MRIGLLDIDCHAGKKKWGATVYPNIALGKLAAWHRAQGDEVEWAMPIRHYDILYRSKIFNFTADDLTVWDCDREVRGGTGYGLDTRLPDEVDRMQPDYSLWPHVPDDTAYGFLTRGCPNRCKWCVVPRKEGAVRPYMDVDEIAVDGRRKLVLMDNNILAAGDYAVEQLEKIIRRGYRVDFNQAMDARLVDDRFAGLMAKVRWLDHNRIRFGCDTRGQVGECERAMRMIEDAGFRGQFFVYTMLTDDFQESYARVLHWWRRMRSARDGDGRRMVYAYAQPFRDPDDALRPVPQWQKDLAGWVNKKAHFVAHSFEEFEPRKGFRCLEWVRLLG